MKPDTHDLHFHLLNRELLLLIFPSQTLSKARWAPHRFILAGWGTKGNYLAGTDNEGGSVCLPLQLQAFILRLEKKAQRKGKPHSSRAEPETRSCIQNRLAITDLPLPTHPFMFIHYSLIHRLLGAMHTQRFPLPACSVSWIQSFGKHRCFQRWWNQPSHSSVKTGLLMLKHIYLFIYFSAQSSCSLVSKYSQSSEEITRAPGFKIGPQIHGSRDISEANVAQCRHELGERHVEKEEVAGYFVA